MLLAQLIESFLVKIILLELLYAVLHSDYGLRPWPPQATIVHIPHTVFIQQVLERGWYSLGDCCADEASAQQVPTHIHGLCVHGPYTQMFRMVHSGVCHGHLKYVRQSLYIQ